MAKSSNELVRLVIIGAGGYVIYQMAMQSYGASSLSDLINRILKRQPSNPDEGGGGGGGGGGGAEETCPPPPFSPGNYVERAVVNGQTWYRCVRNGQVVFSSLNQAQAEQYYNYSYCPSQHSRPSGAAPVGV